jgi:DNA-binding CsgD family transcriptional regulator
MRNMYEMGATSPVRQPSAPRPEQLTPRQLEVLALLCEGLPNKLIGRRLNISSATVKIHVANILRALNVASRLQAVVAACRLGVELKSGDAEPMMRRETVTAPRHPAVLRLVLDESAPHLLVASDRSLAAVAG